MKRFPKRPHGPINQAFSPMFWSAVLDRVVFTKPSRPWTSECTDREKRNLKTSFMNTKSGKAAA